MPPPLRNPKWTPYNDEPEWIFYGPPNPNYAREVLSRREGSTRGFQPRPVPSTRAALQNESRSSLGSAPPLTNLPSDVLANLPVNMGAPSNADVSDITVAPANITVPPNVAVPQNSTGVPTIPSHAANTAVPPIIAASHHRIDGPHVPDLGANNGLRAIEPAPESGIEDRSWEATLEQTRRLLRLKGKRYGRHVKSFEDHKRLKKARKHLLRKNTEDRSDDMPRDSAGQQELIERLMIAISNLENLETRKTRRQSIRHGETRVVDSIGVRVVKEMNEFDMEMLAWDFMVAMRDAQRGHLELSAKFRFENYDTFMDRFYEVELCLRVDKHFVRSALESEEWVHRIAANPRGERSKKKSNDKLNSVKLDQLAKLRKQQKQEGTAGLGTERQGSTETLPEEGSTLSLASDLDSMQGQAQPQLQQQQFQLPPSPGMHSPPYEYLQQPPQHFHNDYSQNVTVQPVTVYVNYINSEQYGNLQQQFEGRLEHANPQQIPGTPLYLAQPQLHVQQHGDEQVVEIPALHESPVHIHSPQQPQQGVNSEPLEYTQQHGSGQQPGQQPTAVPEPISSPASAATPVAYDGPQLS